MKYKCLKFLAGLGFTAFLCGVFPALAQSLGAAASFAVLGGSAVTNTGPSIITGDLGVSPGSAITGFPPGIVTGGTIHAADAAALQAQNDVTTAYNNLTAQPCSATISTNLGGMTLAPGVYCSASSMGLAGILTLDAQGDPNAVFIFKIGSTLTTASNSVVRVINGGQSCNVFWQVGSSATLGTGTAFVGNILALESITMNTGASMVGRALARTGAVTLDSNAVSAAVCSTNPTDPTLGKTFSPVTINAGEVSTLLITLSNPSEVVATLTAPLTDTLPSGVVIANPPNASTTCGSGVVTASAGGNTVTLTGGAIPANGICTLTAEVTAAVDGSYINTLLAGTLVIGNNSNAAPAIAILSVRNLVPLGRAIPTLSEWAMIMFAGLLAIAVYVSTRRQNR
ncbi:MAG: IPTL-CTERM sorting domain-containing protein [Candidatus Contendobacter sp.]|nr:IPTL-CTERM sorting domain-containing protein [Candidatus Contendobacter sp.]